MQSDAQRPKGSPFKILFLWVLIAGVAAFIAFQGLAGRSEKLQQIAERTEEMALPPVRLIAPNPVLEPGILDLPGRLDAFSRASIYARVNGYVARWMTDIGAQVKAGQLLAEIDAPELDQQLLQAESDLKNAEANAALAQVTARRYEALLPNSFVSQQSVDERTSDYTAKQALVRSYQANLERLRATAGFKQIVAPFDGVITVRNTDIGALINSGSSSTPLFVIADTRKLRLYVNVPQTYVPLINPGSVAQIMVPEHPDRTYEATVETTSKSIDVASGTTQVLLFVDNASGELLAGGYASVRFKLPPQNGVFEIPASALIFDSAGLKVATLDDAGKVVLKAVKVSRDLGKTVQISSGINAYDKIIDSPPEGISTGDSVQPIGGAPTGPAVAAKS